MSAESHLTHGGCPLYLAAACLLILLSALDATATAQTKAVPGPKITVAAPPTPAQIDKMIVSILNGANSFGWDSTNHGILINWRRDDPTQVQCNDHKCDSPDKPTRHDPINDVRLLQHMYWYKYRHPEDHQFDAAIARILPTVKQRWGHSHLAKGWVYYVLLHLYQFTDDPKDKSYWSDDLAGWADAQWKHIDPALGVQHDKNMGNCDCGANTIHLGDGYRVDHAVESGAALVDAGTRFHHPEWVTAGYKEVLTAIKQTYSQKYHLFARIYIFEDQKYGRDKIFDAQARMGESSEEVEALMRAGGITTDPEIRKQFWGISAQILDALRDLPIHDREHGGFFNSFYTSDNYDGKKAGELSGTSKESRQLSILGTYHIANQVLSPKNRWPEMEKEMLRVVTGHFDDTGYQGMFMPDTGKFTSVTNGYPPSVAGYTYHLNADYSIYRGGAPGGENWVSNEANSLALLGLEEYLSPVTF